MPQFVRILILVLSVSTAAFADLRLPALFTEGMVLQRDQPIPVWGWAEPGQEVSVAFAGQRAVATADAQGRWRAELPALPASAESRTLSVSAGEASIEVADVLVGEVWVCSGQSNMEWSLRMGYDPDIESITAQFPHLRMIKVPRKGTQEIQDDFEGSWQAATPETALGFSAVGFLFGRTIHEAVRVPVGLIQCSWGGSAAEAWMERGVLEADGRFEPYMARWREREASYDFAAIMAKWEEQHAAWQAESERLKAEGQPVPSEPAKPRNTLEGQQRPGNLYAGMLKPIIGYGMRGVIWYQGESNASRAWEYRSVFPLLIERWRADWGQGDFPFYWV